jgi:methylated-DNA-[protein]-cysteine S-methyltransferase
MVKKQTSTLAGRLAVSLNQLYTADPPEALVVAALDSTRRALAKALPPIVYYDDLTSDLLGRLWVAVTADGVIAIDWDLDEKGFQKHIDNKLKGARLERGHASVEMAKQMISAYLREDLMTLDLPVDERLITPFQAKVLHAAARIPRGQMATYGDIAREIGAPKAFQAVGQALRYNPIPIILPCHRVVPADGTLGGYGGKMSDPKKAKLLKLEGAMLA